jgi:hypothetical protein
MTANGFRKLALRLPEAMEESHMNHPDFRVRGRIFATLGPDGDWAMVKLTPEQQAWYVRKEPDNFEPCSGVWGKRGATKVILKKANELTVRQALDMAWKNVAPKKLAAEFDE